MTSSRPARLLFLAQTLPYPPDGGVQIRTYNVLRILAQQFDVTALCFYRRATHGTPERVAESLAALREFAELEVLPIPQEYSKPRLLADHARSVLTRRPYTVASYESAAFRRRLVELLATRSFDLAHVDSLDLSAYLPLLRELPVVCVHHNVESALLRRRARHERSRALRAYLSLQARLLEQEERVWCGRVALNVAVSDADRAAFQRLVPDARFMVVPNGVDTEYFRPEPQPEQGLVFVGGYDWFPNRDALEYFARDILPLIRQQVPAVSVKWVGRAPADVQAAYMAEHGIELLGYLPDIRPPVHHAACYVVPLRVGGGTRLKILDAWAMGKALVSTSVGCEGLATRDGENIIIRDEPADFAAAVCRVLADAALRARLGSAARITVERTYSWEIVGAAMLRAYRALLEEPRRAPRDLAARSSR